MCLHNLKCLEIARSSVNVEARISLPALEKVSLYFMDTNRDSLNRTLTNLLADSILLEELKIWASAEESRRNFHWWVPILQRLDLPELQSLDLQLPSSFSFSDAYSELIYEAHWNINTVLSLMKSFPRLCYIRGFDESWKQSYAQEPQWAVISREIDMNCCRSRLSKTKRVPMGLWALILEEAGRAFKPQGPSRWTFPRWDSKSNCPHKLMSYKDSCFELLRSHFALAFGERLNMSSSIGQT
jgi:hypothetical protein